MAEKTLAQVAWEAMDAAWSLPAQESWQAVADAVIAEYERRRWMNWPDETGNGEYPPDETPVEVYCGRWASRDRLISQISVKRGTYGPSGASHWRHLHAPPTTKEESDGKA